MYKRQGANGVSVSVAVSGSELIVSSVNTSSTDKNLSSTTSGSNVSFTTDGSHYYVIYEKDGGDQPGPGGDTVTVPVRGDENEIHADVTIDGDTVELHELDFDEIDHIIGCLLYTSSSSCADRQQKRACYRKKAYCRTG